MVNLIHGKEIRKEKEMRKLKKIILITLAFVIPCCLILLIVNSIELKKKNDFLHSEIEQMKLEIQSNEEQISDLTDLLYETHEKYEDKPVYEFAINKTELTYTSLGVFKISHYCPCAKCCGKTNGITASGTIATPNKTVAAGTSLPFGTILKIDGQEYVVEDRGGAIGNNRIDVFCSSHAEALQKGVYYTEVFIKE